MNPKTAGIIAAVFAAGVAMGMAGSLFFAPPSQSADTRISTTVPTGEVTHLDADTSVYRNSTYDFSLTYPSELAVSEYDEGAGDRTIVFRKGMEEVGFQIFITPLSGAPLSKEVIELSHPYVEAGSITATTVGSSTPAFALAGRGPLLGPSREIWFAHNGYVFEVVTYPDRAAWLANIMRNWQPLD
jgi:hypothetical protein